MANNLVYANRLDKTADFLMKEVAPAVAAGKMRFNMRKWADKSIGPPKKELSCGTAACAAGYAAIIFKKQGFKIVNDPDWGWQPQYNGEENFNACREFFGVSEPFDPAYYEDMHDYYCECDDDGIDCLHVDDQGDHIIPITDVIDALREFANEFRSKINRKKNKV